MDASRRVRQCTCPHLPRDSNGAPFRKGKVTPVESQPSSKRGVLAMFILALIVVILMLRSMGA
jgi:hypothetical protein